jgi:hypothetical protein
MLRYIGGGFYPGIPARDLTDDDLRELLPIWAYMKQQNPEIKGQTLKQFLAASGYYEIEKATGAHKPDDG